MDRPTETGPVLTPEGTFAAAGAYHNLTNITPIHFWRPITRKSIPSKEWSVETISKLKNAGFRASVAIGLAIGPGIDQADLIDDRLLEHNSEASGEIWDQSTWLDISNAAKIVGYPVYRSTSCAIALARSKPEELGTWHRSRGATSRCIPCNCPQTQRAKCKVGRLSSANLGKNISWIADYAGKKVSQFTVLADRRVRVAGQIRQSAVSLALHKYQIELVPDSVFTERAWVGHFGRGLDSE
ncbi:hypothetical protein [Amycolatopsis vancoresmycina]|uniref:hypothetical protein n=1 Tax=Amycolatopsis vancoresmycina TaxID=208444 RepID=UPI0012DBD2DA|nr:hypothetical protein [Amycolatopsis vancoresmycina]